MHVITGGPHCGKTSLINCLKEKKELILPETAREIIEEKGIPKGDELMEFQKEVYRRQEKMENSLVNKQYINVFLDRGLGDSLAYFKRNFNHVPIGFRKSLAGRYSTIFFLEPIEFQNDGYRLEKNSEEAIDVHKFIEREYRNQGYDIIHVPLFNGKTEKEAIEKRAEFVLSRTN